MLGIFDSGVGGLSVWQEFKRLNSSFSTLYLADQAFFPYGNLENQILKIRVKKAVEFLKNQGCDQILIACNTATLGYPIETLRLEFVDLTIFGVEPPINLVSNSDAKSLILVTPQTAKYILNQPKQKKDNSNIQIIPMPNLAQAIEIGHREEIITALESLKDYQNQTNLTIGLGCTHYAFAKNQLKSFFNQPISIIDVSQSVAKHVNNQITKNTQHQAVDKFFTTAIDNYQIKAFLKKNLNLETEVLSVSL